MIRRPVDLSSIQLLIRVIELGSVQRAAHRMGIPRSSLRRKLANLEAEIGSELFVRGASGIALTPAGAIVVARGRELLDGFSRMVSSVKSSAQDAVVRVRVVVPVGMPDSARVGLLAGLHAAAPGVCVEEIERAEPLDHLHEPFDLMFHFGEPPERGRWVSRTLVRMRLVPLASEAYLARFGRPASTADLRRHRLISWHVAGASPRQWPLWSGGTLDVEPVFCSYNGQMLHRAAQDGIGILLGNPDPSMLPLPTRLTPLLDGEIGRLGPF